MPKSLITDKFILAYEVLQSMKTRHKGRKGSMTIQLDIFKAYEQLEWNFLEEMMRKVDFDEGWIPRIMRYVTTISYATLVNDHPGSTTHQLEDYARGTHLSIFIFDMC